jgi:tetratricopeptide (TPR) repeat protein
MPKSKHRRKKKGAPPAAAAAGSRSALPLPDRRAMEGVLARFGGRPAAESPVQAAQEVMYDAWDATESRRRIALARKALAISPLCADAYVLLAEEWADSVDEVLRLYRMGVEAGEKALGKEAFEEDVGHFWSILETRPYMRARCGLARALWSTGARDAAIQHYRDMLRLNPNDNQGIRHLLAACLLQLERDEELAQLLREYEGDALAAWTYTKVLAAYRRTGDDDESRRLLVEALKWNEHVLDYLTGKKKPPRCLPPYVTFGGEDEAAHYVADFGVGWRRTSGALQWLASVAPSLVAEARRLRPRPARPG